MFAALVLVTVSCVSAQIVLPDPPRVTVDAATLRKFGVLINPNQPDLFNNLMSITPSINSTDPTIKQMAINAQSAIQNVYNNILDKSAVDVSRRIISIYHPLPEGELAQFISAHILNMYSRLYNILNSIDDNAIQSLNEFNSAANSAQALLLCQKNDVVSIVARNVTREISQSTACSNFVSTTSGNPSIVNNFINDVTTATLNQMNVMLGDEKTSLSKVFSYIKQNLPLPKLYFSLFIRQVINAFIDYENFYKAIENSPKVANMIGMPVPQLKTILINKGMEFLKEENFVS